VSIIIRSASCSRVWGLEALLGIHCIGNCSGHYTSHVQFVLRCILERKRMQGRLELESQSERAFWEQHVY
jgi:hypothetical protein